MPLSLHRRLLQPLQNRTLNHWLFNFRSLDLFWLFLLLDQRLLSDDSFLWFLFLQRWWFRALNLHLSICQLRYHITVVFRETGLVAKVFWDGWKRGVALPIPTSHLSTFIAITALRPFLLNFGVDIVQY